MKLSIVVVAWQCRDLLEPCLQSLRVHAPGCRLLVVDNGPGDGVASLLAHRFPEVERVAPGRNTGFAGGCNLGAARTQGDALLFLNPDVVVLPSALATLASALQQDDGAAAAGGLLVDGSGLPQRRYAPRPLPGGAGLARALLLGLPEPPAPAVSGPPRPVPQVAGACLLVRRSDLEALGGFDESFHPVFFEDVDLCCRLRDRGRRVLHVPEARFRHLGAGSLRCMGAAEHEAAWFGNLQRYARRHHGRSGALAMRILTPPALALRLLAIGRPGAGGRFGRRHRAAAYGRILLRSLTGWPPASPSTS